MRTNFLISLMSAAFLLSGCTTTLQDGPPNYTFNADNIPNPTPKPLQKSKYGNPAQYVINGKLYHVSDSAVGYDKTGVASWYGLKFHGHKTSSGEPYDMFKLTAASRTLPIPTYARVTNLENGKSVIVKVNDRGPFKHNRLIDLSYAAAKKLHFARKGTAQVEVKAITFAKKLLKLKYFSATEKTHYYLQVGVFSHADNAKKLKTYLTKVLNKPVVIHPVFSASQKLFRVAVGPLVARTESAKLNRTLKQLGLKHPIAITY